MKRKVLLIPLIIFLAIAAALLWQLARNAEGDDPTNLESALIGKPVPKFRLESLDNPGQFYQADVLTQGKPVLLNVWATWCPPCREEMPDIEALYKEYGENSEDLVILSVANPKTKDNPNNNDKTIEEVTKFMEDNGYSYPALMDTTGDVLLQYYITAFPTTFMIDREGRVIGYANGALTKDIMKNIITQALSESAE